MKNIKLKLFLTWEIIIYLSFLIIDLFRICDSTYLKYLGIISCFIYALFSKSLILSFSFFFTLLADYFLLVRNDYYVVGVSFFIVVQLIYIIYLRSLNIKQNIYIRIFVPLILSLVVFFVLKEILYSLVIFYFSQMIISLIYCLINKKHKLLIVGLCLFIMCDICVGLYNVANVPVIINYLEWFFYLPSQVLIAISTNY